MALSNYQLKAGVLLQAFGDASKVMTNANITDELAKWHLEHNPACARFFAVMPGHADIPSEIRRPSQNGPTIIVPPVADVAAKIKEPEVIIVEAVEEAVKEPVKVRRTRKPRK